MKNEAKKKNSLRRGDKMVTQAITPSNQAADSGSRWRNLIKKWRVWVKVAKTPEVRQSRDLCAMSCVVCTKSPNLCQFLNEGFYQETCFTKNMLISWLQKCQNLSTSFLCAVRSNSPIMYTYIVNSCLYKLWGRGRSLFVSVTSSQRQQLCGRICTRRRTKPATPAQLGL